jgi:hypothetical protein
MVISKLLPLSLLIAVGAAPMAAQSWPAENSVAVQSTNAGDAHSSGSTDLLSPNLSPNPKSENPLDRIHTGEYRPRFDQFGLPHVLILGPDAQSHDDTLCYAMRSYKVARDRPQSDSTHAAGYSTCQPAARFQVHTTVERMVPARP